MNKHCLVCSKLTTNEDYGYHFCDAHKWLFDFDPEELEMVVIMRMEGKSAKQIEDYYKKLGVGGDK